MKKFNIRLLFLLLLATYGLTVEAQVYQWARQLGGPGMDYGMEVAVDAKGNVYSTGLFVNTADFDPGAGVFELTAPNPGNAYVSKLDAAGNFVWAQSLGSASATEWGVRIALDIEGNVYTVGRFNGTSDFDPGINNYPLTSAGNRDIYISKLDSNGNFVWAKAIGGSFDDYATDLVVDHSGNVVFTGTFRGSVDFDPGTGTQLLNGGASDDVFLCILNTDGEYVKAISFGGVAMDFCSSLAIDASSNLYLTGSYFSTVDFDPGTGVQQVTTNGNDDIFILKLDSAANFQWVRSIGGSESDKGWGITTDADGNVYITGEFTNTVDFDPGLAVNNLTYSGTVFNDMFVLKLDPDGNFTWVKQIGGLYNENQRGIRIDKDNHVVTAGTFSGTVDFNPGPGTLNFTVAGAAGSFSNFFISKLDASGNHLWAGQMGGLGTAVFGGLITDAMGNLLFSGYFSSSADFDPAPNLTKNLTANVIDAFVTKIGGTVTGVTPGLVETNIALFPNPVIHHLRIENATPGTVYRITDALGRVQAEGIISSISFDLDLSPLPAGLYMARFGDQPQIVKLVKE